MSFDLPELDRKKTKEAVEIELRRYRLLKYVSFEDIEASTTSFFDDIGGGRSNIPSDQTGSIAIYNADVQKKRRDFCQRIEKAVARLPRMEKFLIETRYMTEESDYITDYNVYSFKFQPPVSPVTYDKIRWNAFYKLAFYLHVAVTKQNKTS